MRSLILALFCTQLFLTFSGGASAAGSGPDFVGAAVCRSCHQTQHDAWSGSDHFGAMQAATRQSVLGDFSNVSVSFHDIDTRFFQQDGEYRVETTGPDGEVHVYAIKYTFGVDPLQQYLIELDDGHIQAFNIAWDTRKRSEGGQRWFHLRPDEDISPSHPFFWTRHFQNWNSRCADCHSTNVEKNYSEADHRYRTSFSEPNVSCEACHGPAGDHVTLATSGQLSGSDTGFLRAKSSPMTWGFEQGKPIAVPQGEPDDRFVTTCGRCHSLRTRLTGDPQGPYHENYAIGLISEPGYFPDGQIREEVFVLGSFLQSKMYQAGVTCGNCHEPHSLALIEQGNQLCARCHRPETYDGTAHHGLAEPAADVGPAPGCIDCHMPPRTYMQLDARRDHSFVVPGRDPVASRDPEGLAPILKASVLADLASRPSPDALAMIQSHLGSDDPLIRRGAVMGAAGLPPPLRWQLLSPLLDDPSRLVRLELAAALLDLLNQLPDEGRARLLALAQEYERSLKENQDTPAGQLSLAGLFLQLGKSAEAEAAYQRALQIEPDFVPALLNVADYYRSGGRDREAASLLERALEVAPDSAAAQHSYGLYLIRQRQYAQSLPYLKASVSLDDDNPRFAYVLAVALENQGQIAAAIELLVAANRRIPDDFELLYTLALFGEKHGYRDQAEPYMKRLQELAPGSPEVQHLWRQYQRH